MCGILGTIPSSDIGNFQKALSSLSHRGLDDYGIYASDDIILGHRRLSILDLSHNARQPMAFSQNQIMPNRGGGKIVLF